VGASIPLLCSSTVCVVGSPSVVYFGVERHAGGIAISNMPLTLCRSLNLASQPDTQAKLGAWHAILDALGSVVVTYRAAWTAPFIARSTSAPGRTRRRSDGLTSLARSELAEADDCASNEARHALLRVTRQKTVTTWRIRRAAATTASPRRLGLAAEFAAREGFVGSRTHQCR
jgi:hypothetical protein